MFCMLCSFFFLHVLTACMFFMQVTFEIHKENLANIFREHQGKVDEEIGQCSSSPIQAVSGISRDVNVSVGPQQSDTKDSPPSSHITRTSDEKSSIGKTSSVESASIVELQTHNTSNEERTTVQENQELLDEVPLEETLKNETTNAESLEGSIFPVVHKQSEELLLDFHVPFRANRRYIFLLSQTLS